MFSCQFYEIQVSIRERNIKLLLETVMHSYNRNSHMHNYNRNSHVHNALQKIMWRKMWSFQKCGEKTNDAVH